MDDKQEQTIEKYGFQVKNRYRARGAVLLDTNEGPRLMREYNEIKSHFAFENQIKNHLLEKGMGLTDFVIPNRDGELVTEWESGEKYVIYQWFYGDECDYKSRQGLFLAAENLGRLHKNLRQVSEEKVPVAECLLTKYERHNREMKRVYGYMKEKKRKSEFELFAMECFHGFFRQAEQAKERLEKSAYFQENGYKTRDVCHGEYNYHNLIITKKGVATTNFERAAFGMQLMDFAYFFRKVMEKNGWSTEKGKVVLEAYQNELYLEKEEQEFLSIVLGYPVKYWKLLNQYINSKKSWISNKNIEKLIGVREQEKAKKHFLEFMTKL
ncbi:MAG: MarR family transcriptional regulator [Lachnospiraceae bacterium]|nr:MarR family transcriptional regulator [Lachnospiraceae bacterium]